MFNLQYACSTFHTHKMSMLNPTYEEVDDDKNVSITFIDIYGFNNNKSPIVKDHDSITQIMIHISYSVANYFLEFSHTLAILVATVLHYF